MSLRKINDLKVKPVKIKCVNTHEIKGHCWFPQLYCNIFICSKKRTGKSSIVWNILKECSGRDTKIIIFAPTVEKDQTYKHILDYFKKKGNDVITYTSIKEGKEDNLEEVIKTLQKENLDEDEQDDTKEPVVEKPKVLCNFGDEHSETNTRKRKEKYKAPKYIFVLDDLSTELRTKSVATLLKTHRHYKSKVIVSTQYPLDLLPESLKQMDFVLLGTNHTLDKLEEIHHKLDLALPFEQFVNYYDTATAEKFNFLYIDVPDETYRANFSYQFTS